MEEETRAAKELHDLILSEMGTPEGVYLTVAPDILHGWSASVSTTGDPMRAVKYHRMAESIAAQLRKKYALKT